MDRVMKVRENKKLKEGYVYMTIFAGSKSEYDVGWLPTCGTLCMGEEEYEFFLSTLAKGARRSSRYEEGLFIYEYEA